MPVEIFLDTNVLIYSFDSTAPRKRERAAELIHPYSKERTVGISWQVVQEFMAVALGRFKKAFKEDDLKDYLEIVLLPLCVCWPTPSLYAQALRVHSQFQYSWYDSLIITAAISSGAKTLYSEDLQHGQKLGELTILNPFNLNSSHTT